jgi:hypothetical protein
MAEKCPKLLREADLLGLIKGALATLTRLHPSGDEVSSAPRQLLQRKVLGTHHAGIGPIAHVIVHLTCQMYGSMA